MVVEHLFSSDRNSLLSEIQDLRAQLRMTHLQNQEKLQQLQETLTNAEDHGSKQEHQLRRKGSNCQVLVAQFSLSVLSFCIADKKPVLAEEEVGLFFFLMLLFKINLWKAKRSFKRTQSNGIEGWLSVCTQERTLSLVRHPWLFAGNSLYIYLLVNVSFCLMSYRIYE